MSPSLRQLLTASSSLAISAGLVLALAACQKAEPVRESELVLTYYYIPQ